MIPYEITNTFFVGNQKFFLYSLMYVLVLLFGAVILYVEVKRQKLNGKQTFWSYFWVFFGILFGARLFYTFGPWSDGGTFIELITAVINPYHYSGLVMIGGLIFGFLFGFGYVVWRKLGVGIYADMGALIASMGLFFGRIGCFFAGCCFGEGSNVAWAVVRDGVAIHPTQIYSSIGNLFIFSYIVWKRGHQKFRGELFIHFVLLYSIMRFSVEFLRAYTWHWMGLSATQLVLLVVVCVTLMVYKNMSKNRDITTIHQQKNWWYYLIGGGLLMDFGVYMVSAWHHGLTVVFFVVGGCIFLYGMSKGLDFSWVRLAKSNGTKQLLKIIGIVAVLFVLVQLITYGVGVSFDTEELKQCPHSVEGNTSANIRVRVIDSPYCNLCWEQSINVHPKLLEEFGDQLFIEKYDIRHCGEVIDEYGFLGTPGYVFTNVETSDESIYYSAVNFNDMKEIVEGLE
jgi:phosphatidylglycerol:prolipoprotein diacylglycerol transferase